MGAFRLPYLQVAGMENIARLIEQDLGMFIELSIKLQCNRETATVLRLVCIAGRVYQRGKRIRVIRCPIPVMVSVPSFKKTAQKFCSVTMLGSGEAYIRLW